MYSLELKYRKNEFPIFMYVISSQRTWNYKYKKNYRRIACEKYEILRTTIEYLYTDYSNLYRY